MAKKLQNSDIIEISESAHVSMDNQWYDISPIDHFWIKWRFQAVIRNPLVKVLSEMRLLEIGCGHGIVMRQFESLPNVTVDGCDLNPNALTKVSKGKGDIFLLNIFDEPPQLLGKYSGIILFDVLEHLEDDDAFLRTACKYLQNEGLVMINVPAFNTLFSKYDSKMGHLRRYKKQGLQKLFRDNNIEVVSIRYWGFSLWPIVFIRKFILMFTKDEKIVETGFKLPGKLTNLFFNALMKLELLLCRNPPAGSSLMAVGKYTVIK